MKEKIILIQTAMEVECSEILKVLENKVKKIMQGYIFYEGTFNNHKIIISLSKVGLIHASSSLTIAIEKYHPAMILNIGIAGATDKELHTKDIVVGESIININSYRTPYKKEKEGSNPNEWELLTFLSGELDRLIEEKTEEKLLSITKKILKGKNIHIGKIGSGDVWNREFDRIMYLNKKYNIICEDMESIATYTIANRNNIPVISIKMISDNIITGEEYNREVGIDLQKVMIKYLEKLLKDNF